jgi:hypothetical protein
LFDLLILEYNLYSEYKFDLLEFSKGGLFPICRRIEGAHECAPTTPTKWVTRNPVEDFNKLTRGLTGQEGKAIQLLPPFVSRVEKRKGGSRHEKLFLFLRPDQMDSLQ